MAIRARAAGGKFAIYTVPSTTSTDNDPLTNPDGNASRLRFHSDRDYVRVVSTQTGTLSLPARTSVNTQVLVDHQLFAHGQATAPMVMGRITNLPDYDGTTHNVPIASMVPVLINTGSNRYANRPKLHRWVCLAVDDTYVYMREYGFISYPDYEWVRLSPTTVQGVAGWTAQSINWVVHVTDFLVDGPAPSVDPDLPSIKVDSTGVQFGHGKFSSDKPIPRLNASGTDYGVVLDRHISWTPTHTPGSNAFDSSLEISIAGMWWANASDLTTSIPTGPTFDPDIDWCDI